jgi:hypothetical protein
MDPDVVLVDMDDDEPDFTADEIDDMWEFGGDGLDDDDYMVEGCVFPDECCMPGAHYLHECHTPAMIEDQHNTGAHRMAPAAGASTVPPLVRASGSEG